MSSIYYQILFTIQLQHDYHGNEAFNDIHIIPSDETLDSFKNYKILYRVSDNVLTALVASKNNKPVITFNAKSLFRFYLFVENSSFYNYSSLRIIGNDNAVYYFTNKNNNKRNGKLYLSAPVPAYNNANTYEQGSIVSNSSRVFECIQANSNAQKHNTSEGLFWRDIISHKLKLLPTYDDTKSYTPGDEMKSGQKVYECVKANSAIDKHDMNDILYWQEIKEVPYVNHVDLVTQSSIATKKIEEYNGDATYVEKSWVTAGGKFFEALKANSKSNPHLTTDPAYWKEVTAEYIMEETDFSLPAKTFAVVDIYSEYGESGEFALLSAGEITRKDFLIRFKNRSTIWKYISLKNGVTAISDVNGVYGFDHPAGSNLFLSKEPIALQKMPVNSIKLNATINTRSVEVNGLQNPAVDSITLSDNTNNYKIFSEIYLNY